MDSTRPVDLMAQLGDEYLASEEPRLIRARPGRYLAVDGQGSPGGPEFQRAVQALHAMLAELRERARARGHPFLPMPLEAQWWSDGEDAGLDAGGAERWRWRAMIHVPDVVEDGDVDAARDALAAAAHVEGLDAVELELVEEGPCVQALHVGPWGEAGATLGRMLDAAVHEGFTMGGPHHEIYLSDPSHTPPERLRTVLRHPVQPVARG